MFSIFTPKASKLARDQLAEARRMALQHRANAESHLAASKEEAIRAEMYESRASRLEDFLAVNPDSRSAA